MSSKYTTCAKCGVKHSTLVKHKCFKTKKDAAPKLKEVEHDFEKEGETISTAEISGPCISGGDAEEEGGGGEGSGQGESKPTDGDGENEDPVNGEDESEDEGDGDGEGESREGEGDGEGKASKGKAEGDAEGDAEEEEAEGDGEEGEGESERESYREAPEPQMPEPEIPPVIVVVSVLKYAALCAQCAKNGNIEITLVEDGLFVYGHNGDTVAVDTIPWGELELRATRDGQFYVKSVIDGVDAKLVSAREEMIAKIAAIPEGKPAKAKTKVEIEIEAEAEVEVPNLTLPLIVGQRVILASGKEATVNGFEPSVRDPAVILARMSTGAVVYASTGKTDDDGINGAASHDLGAGSVCDVVCDVPTDPTDEVKGGKARAAKAKK